MTQNKEEAIYTERARHIIEELESGKTRDEIAEGLGHSTYKSLDIYMKNKNFAWNREKHIYEEKAMKYQQEAEVQVSGTKRIREIIHSFKQGKNSKEVASLLGFKNHGELGRFMKEKGYIWSSEFRNYILPLGKETKDRVRIDPEDVKQPNKKPILSSDTSESKEDGDWLSGDTDGINELPRYAMSGFPSSKTCSANNKLFVLLEEYNKKKNITQKAILEIALIEFFKKYGFKNELKREFNC